MRLLAGLGTILGFALATPAMGSTLPPSLAEILREAKPKERNTVENIAKRLYPDQRKEIDELIDRIEEEEKKQVAESGVVEGWSGEGSLGGSYSSGNTDEWSFSAALGIKRKDPRWEHKIDVNIDFTDSDGARTEERISAAYRARRDFDRSRFFLFGTLRYDRDPFQGTDHRFTESAGAGYEIIDAKHIDWDVYAGPALRQTDFSDGTNKSRFGAFIATDFKWDITDKMTLRNYSGVVLTSDNNSFRSVTSLTNNIYGELSVRVDLTVDKETNPPTGSEGTDIYSRLSVVYGF
jgi:putative salt-induced outer membrane protein